MPTPEEAAAEYIARRRTVDIGTAVERGWAIVRDNPGTLIGATALLIAVSIGCAFVPVLGAVAGFVLGGPLMGGLYRVFLRVMRGEQTTAGDVFSGLTVAFLPLFLAGFISSILTSVGFLLCIVPGIYLAVGYAFVFPLVVDKEMDFWTAMEVSRRVVHAQWWTMFGLMIVNLVIVVLGVLACGVGLLVAMPVVVGTIAYAYEDLFGGPATAVPVPAPPVV